MAAKKEKAAASGQVQAFLMGQLNGAQKGAQKAFTQLETEAEKVLQAVVARSRDSRKELEGLLGKLHGAELLADPRVKKISKKATQASNQVKKRFDGLQTRVVEAVGVASQTQVREINKELSKLSKKLDAVLGGSSKKSSGAQRNEPRA